MKNLKVNILASALMIFGFTSCVKQMDAVPTSPVSASTSASTYADMNASENFDWSTTKKVNFTFNGTAEESYNLVMKVLDADGNILMQKMQKSDETYKSEILVPANASIVFVTYGAETEKFDCTTGAVTMNIQ